MLRLNLVCCAVLVAGCGIANSHPAPVPSTAGKADSAVRPTISLPEYLEELGQAGRAALRAALDERLVSLVPDHDERSDLLAPIEGDQLDRFPTLTLDRIAGFRPLLGAGPDAVPQPDRVWQGELTTLLEGCDAHRDPPAPVHPSLPHVRYGGFPDLSLTDCQAAQSEKLAAILTALAAQNGSQVTYDGATIDSPEALIDALIERGHHVELRNQRMYADFLSFSDGEREVVWPAWLDTGITLSNGETFVTPMGHSQQAIAIEGPDVDARVMFYLGISGAAFTAHTYLRPAWAGMHETQITSSDQDRDAVLRAIESAAMYLRRVRIERETVAQGLPADGYGYVGVCNDSNAVVELRAHGTITTFPLMRARELEDSDLGDGLDETFRALPNDADGIEDRRDALERAMQMLPDGLGGLAGDQALEQQLALVRDELAD